MLIICALGSHQSSTCLPHAISWVQTVYILDAPWLTPITFPVSPSPITLSLYIHTSTYSSVLFTHLDPSKWDPHTVVNFSNKQSTDAAQHPRRLKISTMPWRKHKSCKTAVSRWSSCKMSDFIEELFYAAGASWTSSQTPYRRHYWTLWGWYWSSTDKFIPRLGTTIQTSLSFSIPDSVPWSRSMNVFINVLSSPSNMPLNLPTKATSHIFLSSWKH